MYTVFQGEKIVLEGYCWQVNILFLWSQKGIKIFAFLIINKIIMKYSVLLWFFKLNSKDFHAENFSFAKFIPETSIILDQFLEGKKK